MAFLSQSVNPLNAELNPICHLLTLLGAHPIFHISRIRVNYTDLCKISIKQRHQFACFEEKPGLMLMPFARYMAKYQWQTKLNTNSAVHNKAC